MCSSLKNPANILKTYSFDSATFSRIINFCGMAPEKVITQCGICVQYHNNLIQLNYYEQALAEKLHKCLSLWKTPSSVCHQCLHKLYQFKNLLKVILVAHNTIMDQKEKPKDEEHVGLYNCKCRECVNKFGSLPVLVDVMEAEEPQPSTSQESSPNKKHFNCTHCDKLFTHRGDFRKHLRTHTGEQPYTCTHCQKKFAHTSNLTRHLRLHSGDRPYMCTICNRCFSRKDKLIQHQKSKYCKPNDQQTP